MSGDRRESLRRDLDQRCWIDVGPDSPPAECRLHNVSKTGAKLTSESLGKLPAEFFLYLTKDGKVGRRCQIVRNEETELGLRFIKGKIPKPRWLDKFPVDAVEA
jgi:hypothetical protein